MGYEKLVMAGHTESSQPGEREPDVELWLPYHIGSYVEGVMKGYVAVEDSHVRVMALQTEGDGVVLIPLWRERLREQITGLRPQPGDRIWFKVIRSTSEGECPEVCVGIDRGQWQALAIPRGWTMERVLATEVWALARGVPS